MIHAERVDGGWTAWRERARELLSRGCPPEAVLWDPGETEQTSLLSAPADPGRRPPDAGRDAPFTVPRSFIALGEAVACHSDPERWSLLYEALWRLTRGERHLLEVAVDPLVHRLRRLEKEVRRDVHKMRAFVRFRRVDGDAASAAESQAGDADERYVAWFEPEHDIVERNARFFVDRFAGMTWSILTPRRSLHWDREVCWSGPGVSRADAPSSDALDDLWRTYYAHTYNPARTRWKAMVAEMPMKYWKNLPEARLIPLLVRESTERVQGMLERESVAGEASRPTRSPRRWAGPARKPDADEGPHGVAPWPDVRGPHGPAEADGCA